MAISTDEEQGVRLLFDFLKGKLSVGDYFKEILMCQQVFLPMN